MVDIDAIKRKMLVKYPFFGSVVANLDYVEKKGLGTAGTDGNKVYYDPDFMSTLSEEEQTFIMAHEVCHVAFDHIFRSEGKDKELWNIATDAVINAYLQKDGLKMVKGGIDIPEAINYDSEEMYQKLLEEKKQNNNQNGNQDKNSSSNDSNQNSQSSSSSNDSSDSKQNNDVGHDTHSLWDEAIKKKKEQSSKQESKGLEPQSDHGKEQNKKKKSLWNRIFNRKKEADKKKEVESEPQETVEKQNLEEQIKEMAESGEKKVFKQNRVERKRQLEELKKSLVSQSTGFGNSTDSSFRNIDDIGISKPLVDWRIILREAINIEIDWSYVNANVEDGVITPHLEDLPKPETEIVLDTSGSINENLLRNFLRECKNILQTSKVKVGCFDTKFYGFNEICNQSDINSMKFQGGGGTDFNVAISAFSNRVENKIIFTDGQAPMPNDFANVIWIVFGNQKITPKGGKVIYISNEQLRGLSFYDNDKGKTR